MAKIKSSLRSILNKASELYDNDQYLTTSQHLSKRQIRTIKKDLKDIAANKHSRVIGLTKILKPFILPTAKRMNFVQNFNLSELNRKNNIVVYMPNHKSHLDEFVIGYTIIGEKIPIPIIAAGENLFKNKVSNFVLKSYGAFKIRRDKYSIDEHYYRLLSSYLGASFIAGEQFMSFQEGTRPRDGKIGLFRKGIIGTIEEVFNNLKNNPDCELEDITFVPMAINWSENPDEKKLTTDVNSKAEDTDLLSRFLNLKKTHSSKDIKGVYLGVGEPLSYNKFVADNKPDENGSYAIGIVNEVRSRVVGMMPIYKEHLLHSSIQFLNKHNKNIKIEDLKQLVEVSQKVISNNENNIKIIETDGFCIDDRLELMLIRDIIKFSDDKLSFVVLNPNLVDYYANHVTSLTEEREI
jgi:glycerol-3-phosphate O-acyltransferase